MSNLPTQISNFIEGQFPEVYRENGPNFVAFVKAYYEWLEQNFQLITLDDNTGFEVNSVIHQGNVSGVVYTKIDDDLLVKVDGIETFKCVNVCSDLLPVTTVTNGIEYSTTLRRGGTTRRLGTIFQARNLQNYTDIDRTIDLFILQFKEKYLKNIQFDTATNKQLLIKNSLDLYRSKGTERSIDMFFRLVYGVETELKRPSDFLFKPSEAEWVIPKYIEISPSTVSRAIQLVGKEITGVTSGATAFVEKYIKLKTPSGFSHILFVSNIKGIFLLREILKDDVIYPDSPTIYGSLNRLEVTNPIGEFKIGDLIDLESETGTNAIGRVVEVRFASGQVEFSLEFGGYGYSINSGNSSPLLSQTLVADHLLTLGNVDVGNVITGASISTPGTGYSNSDVITFGSNFGEDALGSIVTNLSGGIAHIQMSHRGSGFIFQFPNDIPITITTALGSGAVIVPQVEYSDKFVNLLEPVRQIGGVDDPEGFVVSTPFSATLFVSDIFGPIQENDILTQVDPDLGVVSSAIVVRSETNLTQSLIVVDGIQGCFRKNYPITSSRGLQGTLSRIEALSFSIKLTTPERFVQDANLTVVSTQTGLRGTSSFVSRGTNASFAITSISNPEVVTIDTELLLEYIDTPLNTAPMINTVISDFLTYESFTVGSIRTIGGINPGELYTTNPEILLYQPGIAPYQKKDLIVRIGSQIGSFTFNELVQQETPILAKQFVITNTAGFSIGEEIIIANSLGATLDTGVVFDIVDSTTLEISNFTINQSYIGQTIRSAVDGVPFTILGDLLVNRLKLSRGRIKSFDTQTLILERLTFSDNFMLGEPFVGESSGASAIALQFTDDLSSGSLGLNAIVSSDVVTSDGAVSQIEVLDSGVGFVEGQVGTFKTPEGFTGKFTSFNGGVGTGSGSYRSIKGFASDQSKLFDGDYYQEYSYDILSRIPLDKYADMFKRVMHTAGTRFFGSVLIDTTVDISNKIDSAISDRRTVGSSTIVISNTSPFNVLAVNLTAAPVPWGATEASELFRMDLAPTVDFADINIEIRD